MLFLFFLLVCCCSENPLTVCFWCFVARLIVFCGKVLQFVLLASFRGVKSFCADAWRGICFVRIICRRLFVSVCFCRRFPWPAPTGCFCAPDCFLWKVFLFCFAGEFSFYSFSFFSRFYYFTDWIPVVYFVLGFYLATFMVDYTFLLRGTTK